MDRNRQLAAIAESDEERMLLVRVMDKLERGKEREIPVSTAFLTPREQALVKQLQPNCSFFGGTEGAERRIAYYLPDYITAEDYFEDGPVSCLRASFYHGDALSHRDLLGALMGTGIRRDAIGDICLREKECDIFILSELTAYLLDNLSSAGREHLRLEKIPLTQAVKAPQELRELHVTVSSLRLDSVLAAGFHLSRGAAAEAIRAGLAAVDSLTCLKLDRIVSQGSELSLRGKGKMRILSVDGLTRKGRQGLTLGIYV